MKHAEVRQRLSAYLDGEVSEEERVLIEEHLGSCPACDSALKELTKTIGRVKDVGEVEPPPWMAQKIMTRIREEAGLKRGIFRRLFFPLHIKLPIEAVALVLVSLSAYLVYRTAEPQVRLGETPPVGKYEKTLPGSAPTPATAPVGKGHISEKKGTETLPVLHRHRKPEKAMDKLQLPAQAPITETVTPRNEAAPSPAEKKSEFATKTEPSPLSTGARRAERHLLPTTPVDGERAGYEAKPAGRKFESSGAGKQQTVSLKIKTGDAVSAATEIEREISRLGGRVTKTETTGNGLTLTVLADARKLPALLEKLRLLGHVEGIETLPSTAQETGEVTVSIELVQDTGK
jgi:hypothetical protein